MLDRASAVDGLAADSAPALREQLGLLRERFDNVARALQQSAPPVQVAQSQSAEYQAFAQSLREMALLEATMQSVAESGQRVLQRIQVGRQGATGE
jgi:hypothetical protein